MYRDGLEAALARIAELESQLQQRPIDAPAPTTRSGRRRG